MHLNIRFFFRVCRSNCISRSLRGFESVSDDESDVLAVVTNFIVFERGPALQANALEARRRSGSKDLPMFAR